MQTLRAHYDHGRLEFEKPPKIETAEVLVTFLKVIKKGEKGRIGKIDLDAIKKKPSSVDKWIGALKGVDLSNWKKEKREYLDKKYK